MIWDKRSLGLADVMGCLFSSCLQLKYWDRALGLILVSPLCQTPSWTEWLYNKAMINLLYFCGMTGFVKETLLQRYFSPVSCLQISCLYLEFVRKLVAIQLPQAPNSVEKFGNEVSLLFILAGSKSCLS